MKTILKLGLVFSIIIMLAILLINYITLLGLQVVDNGLVAYFAISLTVLALGLILIGLIVVFLIRWFLK